MTLEAPPDGVAPLRPPVRPARRRGVARAADRAPPAAPLLPRAPAGLRLEPPGTRPARRAAFRPDFDVLFERGIDPTGIDAYVPQAAWPERPRRPRVPRPRPGRAGGRSVRPRVPAGRRGRRRHGRRARAHAPRDAALHVPGARPRPEAAAGGLAGPAGFARAGGGAGGGDPGRRGRPRRGSGLDPVRVGQRVPGDAGGRPGVRHRRPPGHERGDARVRRRRAATPSPPVARRGLGLAGAARDHPAALLPRRRRVPRGARACWRTSPSTRPPTGRPR